VCQILRLGRSAFIAVLALIVVSLFSSPALAATKIIDVREQNFDVTIGTVTETRCGITDTFTVVIHLYQSSFVLWSNGVSVLNEDIKVKLVSTSGVVISFAPEMNQLVNGTGSLPANLHISIHAVCTGASPSPGLLDNIVIGETIDQNGMITELHVMN